MTTQVFDDGSTLTYGADGAVVAVTDVNGNAGYVPPPQGSGIVQQFESLFNYGVRAALDARFRPSTAQTGTPQAALGISSRQVLIAGLIVVGALFAYKAFAR